MDNQIKKVTDIIKKGGYGVALTGAGISAESGISTYRDTGGLYDQYDQGPQGGMMGVLATNPDKAPEILSNFFNRIKEAKPNLGHAGLAELERMGFLKSVITQNVDGLHRLAGNSRVLELHGSIYRIRCTVCNKKQQLEHSEFFDLANKLMKKISSISSIADIMKSALPPCSCGSAMRFDFVSFGEPVQFLNEAVQDVNSCRWMLIVGTSGVVHPAASLPFHAKAQGAFLIEVNPKESDLTPQCDIFLQGMAGHIVPKIVSALKYTD